MIFLNEDTNEEQRNIKDNIIEDLYFDLPKHVNQNNLTFDSRIKLDIQERNDRRQRKYKNTLYPLTMKMKQMKLLKLNNIMYVIN